MLNNSLSIFVSISDPDAVTHPVVLFSSTYRVHLCCVVGGGCVDCVDRASPMGVCLSVDVVDSILSINFLCVCVCFHFFFCVSLCVFLSVRVSVCVRVCVCVHLFGDCFSDTCPRVCSSPHLPRVWMAECLPLEIVVLGAESIQSEVNTCNMVIPAATHLAEVSLPPLSSRIRQDGFVCSYSDTAASGHRKLEHRCTLGGKGGRGGAAHKETQRNLLSHSLSGLPRLPLHCCSPGL
jgi:hypothetical protein